MRPVGPAAARIESAIVNTRKALIHDHIDRRYHNGRRIGAMSVAEFAVLTDVIWTIGRVHGIGLSSDPLVLLHNKSPNYCS
jgi:hypothetical protein